MTRRDGIGLAAVAATLAAVMAYRAVFIEPRAWGAACAAASPPLACTPRAAVLWLQQQGLFGATALALGLWGFLRSNFGACLAAILVGVTGVENYNATWSMAGAALGAWCWAETSLGARRDAPGRT